MNCHFASQIRCIQRQRSEGDRHGMPALPRAGRISSGSEKRTEEGKVADYIPALAESEQDSLSVTIYHAENTCLSAGDADRTFTLQSISKVLSLALVLMDYGKEKVFSCVGQEPTGDPFNSMIKLETMNPGKPLNPMINAGALVVTGLIKGHSPKTAWITCSDSSEDLRIIRTLHIAAMSRNRNSNLP